MRPITITTTNTKGPLGFVIASGPQGRAAIYGVRIEIYYPKRVSTISCSPVQWQASGLPLPPGPVHAEASVYPGREMLVVFAQ